jgi:recombinational DNA repair protein RecT
MQAKFIPGYRGLIVLARRSGEISNIYAEAVYEGDRFEVELGLTPKLLHVPNYDSDERDNEKRLHTDFFGKLEVIGNIYQNPELLKGDKV